jgi:hypothetical protein
VLSETEVDADAAWNDDIVSSAGRTKHPDRQQTTTQDGDFRLVVKAGLQRDSMPRLRVPKFRVK